MLAAGKGVGPPHARLVAALLRLRGGPVPRCARPLPSAPLRDVPMASGRGTSFPAPRLREGVRSASGGSNGEQGQEAGGPGLRLSQVECQDSLSVDLHVLPHGAAAEIIVFVEPA